MERRRAAGALLALATCILCTAAAPTASNHTALDLYDGEPVGCYYNFQHYGEGDRIMTNEPCLNCTCHNRMLMCYLRVCPFTKPIGQDCTVEKRADQCCPIVTCPDVPVDLLTLTSTTSPAEYGATGVGKLDKYGCSIHGKYFPEGSKVPPTPNKPCEHCYCIRNMTTCVMQECTLHVDGCTPIYHKDVCCPVRYSCDHLEDEILLLDDKTTTVRPTPGFLLTTTTNSPVTQFTQDCVHDDQIFSDGALIKTEKACEHCYCMKGDIVCVVQECGTPMENEGKNCTSLPPREGQCCPDTYICEGDELNTEFPADLTTKFLIEDLTTLSPPRRVGVEGSGYRKEPDNIAFVEPHPTEPTHEGSGDSNESEQAIDLNDVVPTEDSTKYIHSTVPSIENIVKEDSEKATSVQPSAEIPSSTDILVSEDNVKATTISDKEQEITHEDAAELDKTEITSSIPSYDHKLETSQPEVQSVTESEIVVHDDKITLTTIASDLEKATTVKPKEENVVTDAEVIQHDKYLTTTVVPILEDEGITTEFDREQQIISAGPIEEHSYEPGLHTASTTSAPFLEEVEGIPTGTYGQNVVSDGITESDIYDYTKDKAEATTTTTPAMGDYDNLIDKNKYTGVEVTKIPEMGSHELAVSTTNVPISEEVEKTSTAFPVDLVTSKSSEETYEGDKLISTSTHLPIAVENEEAITENLKESQATTQIPESSDSQKLDDETQKYQTEKYDEFTDQNTYSDYADASTKPSASVIDQKGEEVTKSSEEPVTDPNYGVGSEISDADKQVAPSSAPMDNVNLSTIDDKDINKPQVLDSVGSTKPAYIDDSERVTTQETSHDISTEKNIEQEKSQTPSVTSAPITEEIEMATTEFIKDQDFVTTAIMEQESIKPGEYAPSTSSTPFLEEIEKQTTEVSQGHVVTDVIAEKDIKPPKHVTYTTESPLETEYITTAEPDKGLNTIPSGTAEEAESTETPAYEKTTQSPLKEKDVPHPQEETIHDADIATTIAFSLPDDSILKEDKNVATTEPSSRKEDEHRVEPESTKIPELVTEISVESTPATETFDHQETKSPPKPSYEASHDILGTVPLQELTTETSRTEENTPEKEIKPDVEVVTLSTQITPTLPEITTINLGENEIVEDNVLPPGRIPGEGDCLLNGITYRNESVVPSTNKCHSDCRCVSSIIKCSPIICSSPPEYMDNCQPTYDSPESCCPTYVCDQFRETLPPMPHIQITTELPQQPSSIECRGDQCNIEEHKIQTTVSTELCANNDCGSEIDKKTDISSCGPHGCIESHSTPELCTDGKCTQTSETSEECANGDCKHLPATDVQCEGENCESSVVNIPFAPECENGICNDKVPDLIPVSVPCTEEGGCKGTKVNVAQDCADETCRRKETLDIHAKPTSCNEANCDQTPIQVAIETSTLGETLEIKTESPELHSIDDMSTEAAIYQTTVLEKQDYATEINDYGTTIAFETTQQTDQTSELRPHKESSVSVTQEEPKITESSYTDKESVTETHTKSPVLDSENDVLSTKIPEEYITESHQIDIESPQILTEKQPTLETSESDDSKHTEPTQNVPDTEEHTISVLLPDAEIPTTQPETTEPAEVLATTSEPKVSEPEKYNTEQPEHSITEVIEAQIIDSHKHTSLPDISIAEHEQYTQGPMYTITKSDDTTVQPAVEVWQEITTEDQSESVSEYQSGPKSTTLTPTDIYVTLKESDEKVTESEIQTGDVEMYTEPHITSTSSQAVSIESSTQENTEVYLPDITITSEEHALPTEPSRTSDKVTDVTEESFISSESDKIQKPEKGHVTGNELLEASITEIAEPTTEPSIKDHELNTENGLHVSLSEEEITTEGQKKTDLESTPPPIVGTDDATEDILHEKEVTESSSSASHNIGEEIHTTTVGQDVSTETSEFSTTADLYRITEKPHNIEQESTLTETTSEKSEIPFQDTEPDTDDSIEPVTMPDRTTKLPEILSHTKDHSPESPIATESQTDKFNEAQDNTVTTKQEEPSTEKTLNVVTAESEDQTEKPGTLTEESEPPTIKDEATVSNIEKDKIETPVVGPQEISTEDIYTSDVEKSTEHVESFTTRPELQTTEVFMTDKVEPTTVLTLTEKETASGLPDIIPVTDEYDGDINVQKVEASTEKESSEYTSPQSYAPEKQEPEISYTEKAQTVLSDSTTKTIEAYTTEQSQVLIDTSTSPEIYQVVTGKVPNIKDVEGPNIHETTGITVVDITKADEMFTEPPEKYNIEEDMGTKIQDDVTQQQEFVTDMPEIHAITSSDQYSKAPELIPDTFVTEPQATSEVSDGVQVTELQTPVTELEHLLTTKQPETEEPVKASESPLSTDITSSTIKILTTQDEHAVTPGLLATTEETLSTDLEDITLSSVGPQQSLETETDTVVVTESSHKATTLPESLSSTKSEEASTSLPHLDFTEHGGTQTIASEPLTEEPAKITSQIPDSEKINQEDTSTKTSEPIANVDTITQFDHESHTVPQESATEIMGTELSTEPTLQNASDSHDKDELSEPTSVPVYELPETTPYLIELQEHTHKTIEITTSSPREGEITTEQIVSEGIKHEHAVPETVTDATIDKEAEVQKPTKQYEETSTYEDISEKTTQPTISKDEESLQTTQTGDIDIEDATIYKEQDFTTRMPTKVTEIEKESTPESPIKDNVEKIITTSEKPIQSDLTVKITTPEETYIQSTEKTTTTIAEELPTQAPVAADKITNPEEKPIELSSPLPDLSKPVPSEIQPTDEAPSPDEEAHFSPSGSSGYGNEPDYVEEDQPFSPGTCRYGGKVYVSAQQIPRDDPCDFCFCFRSDIICLQQSCPPPIHGCHEEPIQGFCCPRYECPVSMATTLNVTTTTTTTTTTLPPHFPTHSYKGAAQRRGCQIKGHTYKVGEVVRGSSGPCLHCTCGGDGQMKCDPKACTPEPMLRQMIAAAVSAKRRR